MKSGCLVRVESWSNLGVFLGWADGDLANHASAQNEVPEIASILLEGEIKNVHIDYVFQVKNEGIDENR